MSGLVFTTEIQLEVEVEATLIREGLAATPPRFDCGGEPAEPPEYDISVRYNGHDITALLEDEVLEEIRGQAITEGDEDPDDLDPDY